MRVLNEVLPKGPTTDCVLPGKTFIWLPFAGGISAFAVILPKPLGSVDRVVDGYPDAFHVNRWLRSLEAISPDPQMRASLRSIPPNTSDSRMTLDYSCETPTRLRPATKEPERFLSYSYCFRTRLFSRTRINQWARSSARFYSKVRQSRPSAASDHSCSKCASSVKSRTLGAEALSATPCMTRIALPAGSPRRRPLPQESETI
jgi:hypothetical protein